MRPHSQGTRRLPVPAIIAKTRASPASSWLLSRSLRQLSPSSSRVEIVHPSRRRNWSAFRLFGRHCPFLVGLRAFDRERSSYHRRHAPRPVLEQRRGFSSVWADGPNLVAHSCDITINAASRSHSCRASEPPLHGALSYVSKAITSRFYARRAVGRYRDHLRSDRPLAACRSAAAPPRSRRRTATI